MAGKYFEELTVGMKFKHPQGRTVSEMDNLLFCGMTLNAQPLHVNEDFSSQTQFGTRIMNGIFTMGLVVGLTVNDLTDSTLVANLSYDHVVHPRPTFHGDTIYVETEVLEKRESKSKPDRGIVRFKHWGKNQHGQVVVEVERSALIFKKSVAR
ncbi:MAG: MaoC family dehydratase [Chloroflexota bacterium]|nr:MAG: MaoC family dehydratase [Chloroflexota bacterium]